MTVTPSRACGVGQILRCPRCDARPHDGRDPVIDDPVEEFAGVLVALQRPSAVVEEQPFASVERNIGAGGTRVATGTSTLEELADG